MARHERLTGDPAEMSEAEDAHVTAAAEADENARPLTEAELSAMTPARDHPDLAKVLEKHGKLGRPPLPEEARKQRVTMYLDRDVVETLKRDGKGWQTRANAQLRKALGL